VVGEVQHELVVMLLARVLVLGRFLKPLVFQKPGDLSHSRFLPVPVRSYYAAALLPEAASSVSARRLPVLRAWLSIRRRSTTSSGSPWCQSSRAIFACCSDSESTGSRSTIAV